jgi:hypothetical protein
MIDDSCFVTELIGLERQVLHARFKKAREACAARAGEPEIDAANDAADRIMRQAYARAIEIASVPWRMRRTPRTRRSPASWTPPIRPGRGPPSRTPLASPR